MASMSPDVNWQVTHQMFDCVVDVQSAFHGVEISDNPHGHRVKRLLLCNSEKRSTQHTRGISQYFACHGGENQRETISFAL